MNFEDILGIIFGSFIIGLFAAMFFGNVILAIAAAVGITGIGATELATFIAFLGICGYKVIRSRNRQNKNNDNGDSQS